MLTIIVTLTPNYRHVSVLSKFHPATSSYMRTNFSSSILINYEIPMKNVPLKTNVNRTNIFTYALQIILHCYIYIHIILRSVIANPRTLLLPPNIELIDQLRVPPEPLPSLSITSNTDSYSCRFLQ